MPYILNTKAHNTVSNPGGFSHGSAGPQGMKAPDLGLRITRNRDLDFTLFGRLVESDYGNFFGTSTRSASEIFSRCNDCRQSWIEAVIELKGSAIDPETQEEKFTHPFQDEWNHDGHPERLEAVAPALAVAGDKLFNAIFESGGDEGLKEIGKTLRDLLSTQSCNVAITSSDVFLPWGMLYTHPVPDERLKPDGSNFRKEGFWGYQHLVHQTPAKVVAGATGRLDPSVPGLLSVNFDDRLASDPELPFIAGHITSISELVAAPRIRRTKKAELASDFTINRARLERILYFYCHGLSTGDDAAKPLDPRLILTDGDIKATDFEYWSDGDKPLPTSPLIFINACQGGQMQTLFYQSFAVTLLKQGATGLIGAQIDVPAVFAAEYGERVFNAFFKKGKKPVLMGPLLGKVNRAMWDDHKNPVGLVYSLYRGVNCFIDWGGKPSSPSGTD
jgi:hypothetical protein